MDLLGNSLQSVNSGFQVMERDLKKPILKDIHDKMVLLAGP